MIDSPLSKGLALHLSEQLSDLRLHLSVLGVQSSEKPFKTVIQSLPSLGFYAILQVEGHPLIVHAPSPLIQSATAHLLGHLHPTPQDLSDPIPFSEEFFFTLFLEWMLSFLQRQRISASLQRIEFNHKSLHVFFLDEVVQATTLKLKLEGQPVGIQLIGPVEKKREF